MELRLRRPTRGNTAKFVFGSLVALLTLGLGFTGNAHATNVTLEGNLSLNINGDQITIRVAEVRNNETGGNSGSLRIKLWASPSAYPGSGSCCNGYQLAEFPINNGAVLEGGYSYIDIERTLSFVSPPAGTYRVVMVLLEYTAANGYVIRDYHNFSDSLQIGGGGGGGGASGLSLDGTVAYIPMAGNQIRVDVGQVRNNATGGTSGSLMIKLWASPSSYSGIGSCCNGYLLAEFSLNNGIGLNGGYYLANVSRTLPYTPPPTGTYRVVMVLLEYTSSGYVIVDYHNFTDPLEVGGGGGGGGGGSGGSLSFDGPGSFSVSNGMITVNLSGIRNASTAMSGDLKIKLWATFSPYNGGANSCCTGYMLVEYAINGGFGLPGGTSISNLVHTNAVSIPPAGNYNVVVVLLENIGSGYVIRDYRNFNDIMTVSGGGGGDEGGGGVLEVGTLLGLLGLFVRRRRTQQAQ